MDAGQIESPVPDRSRPMPDHRIRLRGAWERHDPGPPTPTRVDLPTVWPTAAIDAAFTLRRAFGAPPIDHQREAIELEIGAAPGLTAVRLNGMPLDVLDAANISLLITDRLQQRNTVEIDVARLVVSDRPWGVIALRIVTR